MELQNNKTAIIIIFCNNFFTFIKDFHNQSINFTDTDKKQSGHIKSLKSKSVVKMSKNRDIYYYVMFWLLKS